MQQQDFSATHSARLHAQLNLIKDLVRLCSSIGQLQLSIFSLSGNQQQDPILHPTNLPVVCGLGGGDPPAAETLRWQRGSA